MTVLSANEAPIIALVDHLKANITELEAVYDEWPNYQEDLKMPCAAIRTVGDVVATPIQPVFWKHEAGTSYYYVGMYDISIHIDLWSDYKQTRGDMMERVFDLFNKQFLDSGKSLGISLPLPDYHNTIARYDLNGYTYNDNEEGSQRDEWRGILTATVNFSRISTKIESTMDEITLVAEEDIDTKIVI